MSFSQAFAHIADGAIRWPFAILSHLTIFIWYHILKDQLNPQQLFWFIMTALLNPLWGMGGIIATPDIPLLFFWSLALFCTKQLLTTDSLKTYILLGLSLGLGFLSKYQIVLFLPALIWLLWQQQLFKKLCNQKTFWAILIALLTCTPVLIWNYQNDWASFLFQWKHGMSSSQWSIKYPLNYLWTQLLIIFPPFLIFFFGKNKLWKEHWLLPFAVFPFLFFMYSSLKGRVEANWTIMAYPALYALAFLHLKPKVFEWIKKTNILWTSLLAIICLAIPFKDQLPIKRNKLFEADKFAPILNSIEQDKIYLTHSYQLSGFLFFKTKRLFCKFPKYSRIDHFMYMKECQQLPDQFTLFLPRTARINWGQDFPLYSVKSTKKINDTFVAIEVFKK